jgi:hypothetical protein
MLEKQNVFKMQEGEVMIVIVMMVVIIRNWRAEQTEAKLKAKF